MCGERGIRRAATLGVLALALVLPAGCASDAPPRPRNVLLISIDSLRADRLGSYGNPRDTSPTLDGLAASGTRFTRAYSPTSWTLPSHATLLTGLRQKRHGAVKPDHGLRPGVASLAAILSERGYHTRGVFSGPFLDARYGFARGFDEYVSCQGFDETSAAALVRSHSAETNTCLRERVATWSRTEDTRPFFWFVHMWDVHYDYIPPEKYVRRFDPGYRGDLDGRRIAGKGFPARATSRDVAHLLARYDGEIRYVDDTIAAMLAAMGEHGLLDDTLVVVTADHGEEFREHGGKGHRRTVYVESVHVPLIVRGRGVPQGRVVETPVGLVDVAPTVLDLLGVAGTTMDGTSLRGLMEGTASDHRAVVSVLHGFSDLLRWDTIAVRDATTTLYLSPRQRGWVQYDSARDAREQFPMPVRNPRLRSRARKAADETRLPPAENAEVRTVDLPEAMRDRLKALGYVE